jgi:EAL domain-containing protein (putative c-di-GMP-specific phosphodiesterase class I)
MPRGISEFSRLELLFAKHDPGRRRIVNPLPCSLGHNARIGRRAKSPPPNAARAMLQTLRRMFVPSPPEPDPGAGAVTLGDVLRRNWFELWYQPKIELRSMRLVGAEGLVRARRPDGSVMSPGAFLAGASEPDMLALTERVIVTALRDWEACAAHGASVKLSVNVPVSAFLKLPIARMLREERPAAAHWPGLILEVTEDEVVADLALANDVADELRAHNCTLALDDFGTAYSSLARLRQLPFSELKIDKSYVTNCHADRFNAGLCETIVELSKRFGLKTVAEGIETTHESHKLQGIGCDVGQGYLFAKPMSKDQFLGTMSRRLVGGIAPAPRRSALRGLFAKV